MADPEVRHRSMAHHLSYLLLSPAAIHLAFWPPDCGRFHPLHPLFAPNRVAQADHGMPENTKTAFLRPRGVRGGGGHLTFFLKNQSGTTDDLSVGDCV